MLPAARLDAQVDIGVLHDLFIAGPRADFEEHRLAVALVLQMMAVGHAGFESHAIASAEPLFALIGHQHELACDHIDELVLSLMPVTLTRPAAWWQAGEVDAKLRKTRYIAESI